MDIFHPMHVFVQQKLSNIQEAFFLLEIQMLCSMRVTSYTGIFQKLFAFVSPLFRFRSFELTLPETNIGPKTPGLEDEFPFEKASCQVRTVSFREGRNQSSGIGIGFGEVL